MDVAVLAALAEPNRLRIVELLDEAPRPVGEIATVLGLRQPQVTKHLQRLERAGLVRVHPLGQRRVYALRRAALAAIAEWAAALGRDGSAGSAEDVLVRYERAIGDESRRLATDRGARVVRMRRVVAAPPERVWAAWTDADLVRRWWSPQHLRVARCAVEPVDGGELTIVLEEGDGTRHRSRGRFTDLVPPERLAFESFPEGPDGRPVFRVSHTVRLVPDGARTIVTLRLRADGFGSDAAPVLGGLRIGWEQTLDNLAALFTA